MKTMHSMMFCALAAMSARSLTACGAAPEDPAAEAQAVDTAPLAACPAAVDFGTVAAGVATTRSVTLTNLGRADADVAEVTFVSAFPPDPCRAVLLQPCIRPGESVTLAVTCAPTAAGPFGGRVAVRYASGGSDYALSVSVSGAARR